MKGDPWEPEQYRRFRAERRQPFFDLLALVRPKPQMRVVDLGCGPGELTDELHHRLGARETVGIDSSEAMLQEAGTLPFREALGGYTHLRFVLEPEDYASLLEELGYREQHVRLQVYGATAGRARAGPRKTALSNKTFKPSR